MRRRTPIAATLSLLLVCGCTALIGPIGQDKPKSPHFARTIHHRPTRSRELVASASEASEDSSPKPPSVLLLMSVAGLQSGCFGCIGTALPPALRASGLDPSAVPLLLGRLGSASALCEVLLSNSFGKLSDAIGRKPIMLAAPAITVLARSMVVLLPTLPVLSA